MKNKSIVEDNPASEKLVGQALDEIFRSLQQYIIDRKRIPYTLLLLKKEEWFEEEIFDKPNAEDNQIPNMDESLQDQEANWRWVHSSKGKKKKKKKKGKKAWKGKKGKKGKKKKKGMAYLPEKEKKKDMPQ